MGINLTQYERGDPFTGDYQATLSAVQDRLAQLQLAQIVNRRRALIIIEGWLGAGKGEALKRLVGSWDPCHLATHCVEPQAGRGDNDRHWLAPFWSALPPAGDTTIFFGSWYRRLAVQRLDHGVEAKQWARACDEINEFESQQRDHGTLIVKLFFHISAEEQAARLRERETDPWQRHLLPTHYRKTLARREQATAVVHEMFAQTDTRWAPWKVIDATDEQAGRIAALTIMADALAKEVSLEPPAIDETILAFPQQKTA